MWGGGGRGGNRWVRSIFSVFFLIAFRDLIFFEFLVFVRPDVWTDAVLFVQVVALTNMGLEVFFCMCVCALFSVLKGSFIMSVVFPSLISLSLS